MGQRRCDKYTDLENFPTLVVDSGEGGLFVGAVLPQLAAAERIVQRALADGLAAPSSGDDVALAARVRALVAARATGAASSASE